MGEKYTKDFLVKEIAARASFSIGDVKIIMRTFEDIIEEVAADHDELLIGGLFKMYAKEMVPHKGFSISKQKAENRGTTYRLVISPSTTLRRITRDGKIDKTSPPDEEE